MSTNDERQAEQQFFAANTEPDAVFSILNGLLPQSPLYIPAAKRASVAIILRRCQSSSRSPCQDTVLSSFELLFIQRASRPTDPWSAHIAFPGGHREPMDESDLLAAIRETREEIGLNLSNQSAYLLLGRLSDRPIRRGGTSPSGILCPFVFLQLTNSRDQLSPQPTEVAAAFWAPLDILHGRSARTEHMMTVRAGEGWVTQIRHVLGFARLRMPAVDVLPYAKDMVRADNAHRPEVLLWGMTLACVGDLVQAFGGRRVDWPVALPENKLAADVINFVAEVLWWTWERLVRPERLVRRKLVANDSLIQDCQ